MSSIAFHHRFRHALSEVNAVAQGTGGADVVTRECRSHRRYRYMPCPVFLDVLEPQGSLLRYDALPRNLSTGGAAAVVGQYIYPGPCCRLRLVNTQQQWVWVAGRLCRCRYIPGTTGLYEVGVQFDKEVDVGRFESAARQVRAPLLGTDPDLPELLRRLCTNLSLEFEPTGMPEELLAVADNRTHAWLAIDLDSVGQRAASETLLTLRTSGFLRPVVAITAAAPDTATRRFDAVLAKPVERAELHRLLASILDEPLVSTLCEDDSMADLVDRFVEDLPETVRTLALAWRQGDEELLGRQLRRLGGQAGSYGFEVITAHAFNAVRAIEQGAEVDRHIHELIRTCLAAQPVTC